MTVRVYIPTTLDRLAASVRAAQVDAIGHTAFAVTPELERSAPGADSEELEFLATTDAARASLRLIGGTAAESTLRVVIAADVPTVTVRDDLDRAVVKLEGPVPWSAVAAVLMDGADAADAVAAAATAVDAADLGDLDAEFVVGSAEDYQLAWYAPGEISYLLEELGQE